MRDEFWDDKGIAYRTNGLEEARETLVFIHGLGPSCSIWEGFEAMLEGEFNILTYDLRGHGWSKKYENYADYDLDGLADDLRALLEHLRIRSCTLVSHSLGTLVALLFIRGNPGSVRRNLLLSPVYRLDSAATADARAPILTRVLNAFPRFSPRQGRVDFSRVSRARDLDFRRIFLEIRFLSLRVYLFYLRQMDLFPHHAKWPDIDVPTTILHGTKDSFAPHRLAVELSKIIQHSKLVSLEGANHMIIINNRADVVDHIRAG